MSERTTRTVLAEMNNERWAAMIPTGRVNCRRAYRWMRRDGVGRRQARTIVDWTTVAGETAGLRGRVWE